MGESNLRKYIIPQCKKLQLLIVAAVLTAHCACLFESDTICQGIVVKLKNNNNSKREITMVSYIWSHRWSGMCRPDSLLAASLASWISSSHLSLLIVTEVLLLVQTAVAANFMALILCYLAKPTPLFLCHFNEVLIWFCRLWNFCEPTKAYV